MSGILYLIPTTLGDSAINDVIPDNVKNIVNSIDFYIVENIRTARRYLRKLDISTPIDSLTFYTLNKHTTSDELTQFLSPISKNNNVGVISEAGAPGVADPGADIVKIAHKNNIKIVPLVGPSSILLSLMASGLNGQNFSFLGYIPIKNPDRIKKIKAIEKNSFLYNQTQIFIEAPYRNQSLLTDILKTCNAQTQLCIASDITLDNEFIKTKSIAEWKKNVPQINKRPTIFLLHKY
ncbi:MAG: SAM-dependent methyltransferase [Bacteroidetes bacterium]|nr:MAG: SAM-dependent methyltransferase [Bacteroidota bacterium]